MEDMVYGVMCGGGIVGVFIGGVLQLGLPWMVGFGLMAIGGAIVVAASIMRH